MRRIKSVWMSGLLVLAAVSTTTAQQFTGGLRGAVRDANGVIPGVTVALTNEGTAISREAATNEQGQYNFSAVTPGTYTVKAALQGFKSYENKGVRIGTQQFITLDILHGSRADRGIDHGHRAVADHRDVERLGRRVARPRSPRKPAGPRPRRLPHRRHGPDGQSRRRPAVQPAAGSDQRLADLARRRRRPGQQLHGRWRADHRADRPRRPQPVDRSDRRSQGAGAHLRRRHGTHGRRRVQHDGQGREPTSSTAPASTSRGRCGASRRTISTPWRA